MSIKPAGRIRVLIVDDSALARSVLSRGLASSPDIEVVGQARDPYEARDLLVRLKPDVITLDVEMPRMDGLSFLRKFMTVLPTPTIVLSSLMKAGSTLAQDARAAGAVDVLTKPKASTNDAIDASMQTLIERVKLAATRQVSRRTPTVNAQPATKESLDVFEPIIGVGASTGGVAALGQLLPVLPASTPGLVIVQHMAAGFTDGFARRLDEQCAMRVTEARDGDRITTGHILVAPGGTRHLEVQRSGREYRVRLREGPLVSGHAPSVDVFFESLASAAGKHAVGCLLTGMGADGARGLLRMRVVGAHTIIQDRATSAVWGMPAAAQQLGAAAQCLPLQHIAGALLESVARRSVK